MGISHSLDTLPIMEKHADNDLKEKQEDEQLVSQTRFWPHDVSTNTTSSMVLTYARKDRIAQSASR